MTVVARFPKAVAAPPTAISAAPLGHDGSARATQGRPGPSGGGLAWDIFGNAFSVEEGVESAVNGLLSERVHGF